MPSTANCKRWRHDEQRSSALKACIQRHDLRDHSGIQVFINGTWKRSLRLWYRYWKLPKIISRKPKFNCFTFLLHRITFRKQTLAYNLQSLWKIYQTRYWTHNNNSRNRIGFGLRLFSWYRGWQKNQSQIRASLSEQNAAFVMEAA